MPTPPDFLHTELQIDGVDFGILKPIAFQAHEGISAPYEVEIDVSVDGTVGPASLLRKGAQLDVLDGEGKLLRRFEGVLTRVLERWGGTGSQLTLTVRSPLASLELSSDCRIFQELSAPDIVKKVLLACGIPAARCDFRLSGSYLKHVSCTQYRETMFSFVSRLLEEEGIFYFIEVSSSGLKIVFGDAASSATNLALPEVRFTPDSGLLGMRAVTSISSRAKLRPGKITLRDLDWKRPSLGLEATVTDKATADGATKAELYDHPGGYEEPAEGKRRAENRMQALAASSKDVHGTSTVPELSAGHIFKLKKTWDDALDGEWLLTRVEHSWTAAARGAGGNYNNTFHAIPKSQPFRPMLHTPRPRIAGPQTAIVTGPSGQEIHTDSFGNVKLKFPWDRHSKFDDKSSAWARVAQAALTGSMTIPRVGWEVLVEFEHGDPDRPIVVGRLFNGTYVPPYALPGNKTRSTFQSFSSPGGSGHNELRIEDAAGTEHIHMHAQKDLTVVAANNRDTHITTSSMTVVKVDQTTTVKENCTVTVGGMCDVTVAGDQSLSVTGVRDKTVTKDEKITVIGDRSLTITGSHDITTDSFDSESSGGDVTVKVGGNLEEKAAHAIRIAVGSDASLTVGGACSEIAKTGRTATTGGKRTETVGGMLNVTSNQDLSLRVGGKKTSTIGAAWAATAKGDIQLSSSADIEIKVGAAMALTGTTSITLKVGSSKVTIGQGGVVIDSPKIKMTSSGPALQAAGLVGSK